jgi:hypothetical protein
MADLQSALYRRLSSDTAVAALVGTRIYWTNVPQGAALPYIRLQTISDPRPQHLRGYQGSRVTRVQADVFSSSYAAARSASEAVITATALPATVEGVKFGRSSATGPRDFGEDVDGLGHVHRLSTDLLIEHINQ